jgi:hypothetical protein
MEKKPPWKICNSTFYKGGAKIPFRKVESKFLSERWSQNSFQKGGAKIPFRKVEPNSHKI